MIKAAYRRKSLSGFAVLEGKVSIMRRKHSSNRGSWSRKLGVHIFKGKQEAANKIKVG